MKKALVVLLILAVAGGLFAQVVITGEIKTGIGVLINNEDDSDPMIGAYSTDTNRTFRADLNLNYTSENGLYGAFVRLRSEGLASATVGGDYEINTFAQRAFGYGKFFDGLFSVYGGWFDYSWPDDRFSTQGGIDTAFDMGRGVGLVGIVSPIPGLDIGLSVFGHDNYATLLKAGRYHISATYTAPGLLTALAQLRIGSGFVEKRIDALAGVKILALSGLGINQLRLDFAFLDFGKEVADWSTLQLGQRVQWVGGPLTIGLRALEQFRLFKDDAPDGYMPDITFYAWVAYLMNATQLKLDALYNIGSGKNAGDWRKWDGTTKGQFTKDAANLQIRPNVQFRFGGTTTDARYIELGYALFYDLTKDVKDTKGVSMYHNIYADFKVSF